MQPPRIVSLVPSLTELVWWLGAGDRLVGRTKFCTEPAEMVGAVPAVGGTKNPDVAKIVSLSPDLVIANREENRRDDIEELAAAGCRVLLTDPNTVGEAVGMIREVGRVLGLSEKAETLAADVEDALKESLSTASPDSRSTGGGQSSVAGDGERTGRVRLYVGVWHNPMMGLGSNSYGHSLLEACGGVNVLGQRERYPGVSWDEVEALRPDLILLPDEPFPFDEGHARAYSAIAPARVIDGKLLWWYGPRMPAAIRELRSILAEADL